MMYELMSFEAFANSLNYGYQKVPFRSPLPVDSRIRMYMTVGAVEELEARAKLTVTQEFEREGQEKPVCVAEAVSWCCARVDLDDELRMAIAGRIRERCSPRHVPDENLAIEEVPRTLSGKPIEVPVKRILTGVPVERAVSRDSLADPAALEFFVQLALRGDD
jgi:hypothetical protein